MSFSNSILSNLTNSELEIIFKNSTNNTTIPCKLAPRETVDLKVIETPYQIIITKIDGNEVEIQYDTIITSYMSIMIDYSDNQLYIQDFLNNVKVSGNKRFDGNLFSVKTVKATEFLEPQLVSAGANTNAYYSSNNNNNNYYSTNQGTYSSGQAQTYSDPNYSSANQPSYSTNTQSIPYGSYTLNSSGYQAASSTNAPRTSTYNSYGLENNVINNNNAYSSNTVPSSVPNYFNNGNNTSTVPTYNFSPYGATNISNNINATYTPKTPAATNTTSVPTYDFTSNAVNSTYSQNPNITAYSAVNQTNTASTPFYQNNNSNLVVEKGRSTYKPQHYLANQNAIASASSYLSIQSQLHRSSCTILTELIGQNSIQIENNSTMNLLIRLSGAAHHAGKEFYIELDRNTRRLLERSSSSIYKLQVTTAEGLKGTVFNVKVGCSYKIDESFNLVDPAGNAIISSSTDYSPLFEWKNAFSVFYDKADNSFVNALTQESILVANKAADGLIIRLLGDNTNKYEDCVEIESLVCLSYCRKPGKYVATVTKNSEEVSNKYELETGNCYVWDATSGFVNLSRNSVRVEQYVFRATEQVNNSNNNVNADMLSISENWLKLKSFIKGSNNKRKIRDFSNLLFRFVEVANTASFAIHVRIISKKIGSEEFMLIKPNEALKWKRFDGDYLTEVILPNLKSRRFYLTADRNYAFTNNAQMINLSNNNVEVLNTKDAFGGDELIYYDESSRRYLRQKIDYSGDAPNNKSVENFNSQKNSGVSKILNLKYNNNNSEVPKGNTVYEYYNGITPDYTPGQHFTDKSFPPNKTTLAASDPLTGQRRKPHFQHLPDTLSNEQISSYQFKRPKDLFKGKYYLYKDEICYDDVKQGVIGDCFLMSVIASISQRPDLIKSIFKSTTVNPDGFYELFYWENGKKKLMYVDDHFVTGQEGGCDGFPFAQPNGEELWVMLIEKAYAKYEGGFSNIIGGVMATELTWLTGAMARHMRTTNPNCWSEIINAVKAGYIITSASQAGSGNHFNQSNRGISNGHAYSILDAKEYRDGQMNLRLVKLRNPWGQVEWKGDYSDNCPKWTPELKRFFKFEEGRDDGLFFMTFEDYKTEFANVVICCIECRQ